MKYKIEITEQQLQILSSALGKLPFEVVAPLISELQKQINDQQDVHK